jgi:hypothetical protein
MQHIDNDMDELFNKAGRDYPLKTDNSNWDAVFGKLQQPSPATAPLSPKTNRRYYWLLLLLLLPLSYLLVGDNKINKDGSPPVTGNKTTTNRTDQPDATGSNSINENTESDNIKSDNSISGNTVRDNTVNNKLSPPENTNLISPNTMKVNSTSKQNTVNNKTGDLRSPNSHFEKGGNRRVAGEAAERRGISEKVGRSETHQTTDRRGISSESSDWSLPLIPVSYTLSPYSIIPPPIKTTDSPAIKKTKPARTSKLYAGLLAGPDLSTIKYQKIKNAGFSVGILGGYKFSNHWALEAGFLYSKKKYYTDGKYFDKSGTNISPSVMIKYLDGACEMFEVPISVRYNFSAKENTLFATAGITSYFMNEEYYDYWAYSAGSWYDGYRSYDNSGNHFFSNMQFSVGYNYKLSNKLSIRLEPYIKIPVSNIGVGNMPITSTGVYFGIMRRIR